MISLEKVLPQVAARRSYTYFPLRLAPGWVTLVRELDAQLSSIDPSYSLVQVEEYEGGLRYYVELSTDLLLEERYAARRILDESEERSHYTCWYCGAEARMQRYLVPRPVCSTCVQQHYPGASRWRGSLRRHW